MADGKQIFHFVMIKPTHYDDDGYPITWHRSFMPSNTLAALFGLIRDAQQREVLGPDVEIRYSAYDETNTRVRPERILRQIRAEGGKALIGFVGVQTNQFPRAVDLAQPFLKAGLQVAFGGFHISGCLAMLKEMPPEMQAALDMGITFFAGEAEDDRLTGLLRDAWNGEMKPVYNYMNDLPSLEGQPLPFLPAVNVERTISSMTSFDLGRGCPYQCSFCTIINVQGRKSRFRTADDLEAVIRQNAAQGINSYFVTDDDLARNRNWESLFDRLIHLREAEGLKIKLTIQVDTLCHKIDGFIDKACQAGTERVFIGLENINPDNLLVANKRQNKINEYRDMLHQWRAYGTTILAGYILGFPADTRESILHDIEIIKRELPIDILEFFYLTPLPGSADHKAMAEAGTWMDPDPNNYDLIHRVTHHGKMSDAEWEKVYDEAWHSYYTPEHIETIGRRAAAQKKKGVNVDEIYEFYKAYAIEGVHPLESGILRRKYRRDRRPSRKLQSPLVFYPAYWAETAGKLVRWGLTYRKAKRLHARIWADPARTAYSDIAMTAAEPEAEANLALLKETAGADKALKRQKVIDDSRRTAVPVPDLKTAAH